MKGDMRERGREREREMDISRKDACKDIQSTSPTQPACPERTVLAAVEKKKILEPNPVMSPCCLQPGP